MRLFLHHHDMAAHLGQERGRGGPRRSATDDKNIGPIGIGSHFAHLLDFPTTAGPGESNLPLDRGASQWPSAPRRSRSRAASTIPCSTPSSPVVGVVALLA